MCAGCGRATGRGGTALASSDARAGRICRLPGHKCLGDAQCCSGICSKATRRSRIRQCICPAGLAPCRGTCVELGTEEHCLACADACPGEQVCFSETGCACPDGLTECGLECVELGTNDHCQACGQACANGEGCCGERGCIELGTDTDCLSCDDACDVNAAGDAREFCDGSDGCQTVCGAIGNGYATTDWPPQFFTTIRWSAQNYTNPAFGGSEVTTCDTSADCTACPAKIQGDTKTVVGCGCIKSVCVAGTEFLDFYSYYPDTAPNEYYCAVFYN